MNYDVTKGRCRAGSKTFSVYSDGKSAVDKHMNGNSHKTSMKVFQEKSLLTVFLVPQHESDTVSAAEGVLIYHGVKHGRSSYNSQKCTMWQN